MFMAVDIGNTDAVFGIYKNGTWETERIPLTPLFSHEEYIGKLNARFVGRSLKGVKEIVVSSVVPKATEPIVKALEETVGVGVNVVDQEFYKALPILVSNSKEIGTDLVANAVAAHENLKNDCLVIDFGTALTFTIITDKKIMGVNIAPGLKTSMKALIGSAAQLDDIPLVLPESVIGHDTKTAIQSGILWGYVGLVERMIDRIEESIGHKLNVIATGGLSEVLTPLKDRFTKVDPNLTLEGVRLIYRYNLEARKLS